MAEIEEKAKQTAKQATKKTTRAVFRAVMKHGIITFLPILLILAIIIIILAAAVYFITVDDGTYKEDDWGNTNYGASQYVNSVSVNSDKTLSSSYTAQDLWDKMIKNGCRVDKYLDSPEELARLMKAEIVTKYPDMRENPDDEIDWQKIVNNSDTLQGIIKFKRADSNNKKTTMVYANPEEFQGYIDEYNSTGSDEAKNNALTHFTLKQTSTFSAGGSQNSGQEVYGQDGYSEEYTSSMGITYKHYKQIHGSYSTNPYWSGTIRSDGCGPTSVAILASGVLKSSYTPGDIAAQMTEKFGRSGTTSSEHLKIELQSLGMKNVSVNYNPTASVIQESLKSGKVMLVSVNSKTIFTGGKHIMALLDIASDGKVYIGNPSSDTKYGWYDVNEILKGEKVTHETKKDLEEITLKMVDECNKRTLNTKRIIKIFTTATTGTAKNIPNIPK